ncbi:MAG: hypothetical protein U5N53_28280 [Mycobacterium sp.]|nr:hypothetical protein [Mycobacterium sp.]
MTWRLVRADALQFVQLFVLAVAFVRGVDYLLTPRGSSALLNTLESAAPLWLWATAFMAAGATGLAGEWWMSFGVSHARWVASFTAHAVLSGLYVSVALGSLIDVLEREPLYGFRTPAEWFALAVVHAMFVKRRERV